MCQSPSQCLELKNRLLLHPINSTGGYMDEGLIPEERKKQKQQARQQRELIQRQRQTQLSELAETQNELARKQALALSPRKGRRSLINPQSLLKTTLG